MKKTSPANKPSHITTGDIFDDLGFSPSETLEAKIKADIWRALIDHIEAQQLTQADLATALKLHQPDVSNLLRGKLSKFSITKLIQLAGKLDMEARVEVKERPARSKTARPTRPKGAPQSDLIERPV